MAPNPSIYRSDLSAGLATAPADPLREDQIPYQVDARKVIDEVPVRPHPQYGVHIGWSMFGLLVVGVVLGIFAFITQFWVLFWAVSLTLSTLIVSVLYPGWIIHSVHVAKTIPETGIVSNPLPITFTVFNKRKLFSVYSLRLVELFGEGQVAGFPRIYIPYLGGDGRVSFQVVVTPSKRGRLSCLGTRLGSKYPFGLLTRFLTQVDNQTVTVYPPLGTLTAQVLPRSQRGDLSKALSDNQNRGSNDEFYALREYRLGDNPRLIHWKRTARVGRLVVREMSQYTQHRLTVVLDTHLPKGHPQAVDLFEQMVSFAATVCCHSLEQGYRTGLVCTGVPPLMIPPLAGREAQHRILRMLSGVESQSDVPLADTLHEWRLSHAWQGRCFLLSLAEPSGGIVPRISRVIGPTQIFVVGSKAFRRLFIPPSCLKIEVPVQDG